MSTANHKINLYYAAGACSLAPHIILHASGIPFTVTEAKLTGPFNPEFAKLNPKKQVPFIELEPGVILTEIPAIMTAISGLVPEKKILGEPGMEVIRSYEWMNYLSGQVHARRFAVYFRPEKYVNDKSLYPMVKELALANIREAFEIVEDKLKDRKPVDSENIRAVDAYLFVFFRWANNVGIDMQKEYPRYYERMMQLSKLEPVIKAAQMEGIKLLGG